MPTFRHGDTSIHYAVSGEGPALLLCAPGGMRSEARSWRVHPGNPAQEPVWIDPMAELSNEFRVIEMDQRNAGDSTAPITKEDGWQSYSGDQLALLDHLGVDSFAVMGGCIGCSYALALGAEAPHRVLGAVLQNPIGRSDANQPIFNRMFDEWAGERGADLAAAAAMRNRMFGGDFVFSVSREFVSGLPFPILVLPGDDNFHPAETAMELASLAPRAKVCQDWRADKKNTAEVIRKFLLAACRRDP